MAILMVYPIFLLVTSSDDTVTLLDGDDYIETGSDGRRAIESYLPKLLQYDSFDL